MNKLWFVPVCLAVALLASGCAQTGMFTAANLTSVELTENNYRLVATDVAGNAQAGYLLGLSFPSAVANATLAVARIEGTGMLYREALADLWANFEAEHGAVQGRKLALVNVRYDSDNLNLLVYARPRLSIRADVVEFVAPGE
jgi:hypothetical protein